MPWCPGDVTRMRSFGAPINLPSMACALPMSQRRLRRLSSRRRLSGSRLRALIASQRDRQEEKRFRTRQRLSEPLGPRASQEFESAIQRDLKPKPFHGAHAPEPLGAEGFRARPGLADEVQVFQRQKLKAARDCVSRSGLFGGRKPVLNSNGIDLPITCPGEPSKARARSLRVTIPTTEAGPASFLDAFRCTECSASMR